MATSRVPLNLPAVLHFTQHYHELGKYEFSVVVIVCVSKSQAL
jgi:hypothetical protein